MSKELGNIRIVTYECEIKEVSYKGQFSIMVDENGEPPLGVIPSTIYDTISGAEITYMHYTSGTLEISGEVDRTIVDFTLNNFPTAEEGQTYTETNGTWNYYVDETVYTITSSASAGGTISPSGETTVDEGEDQTFTITPSEGYKISSVLVDGVDAGAVSSYTFTNVQADHTISVAFEELETYGFNLDGMIDTDYIKQY